MRWRQWSRLISAGWQADACPSSGLINGFAVVSWLGAIFLVDDILNRLILADVPVAGLAFALLAGFHWPRATTAAAWASAIVGIAWGAGAFLVIGEAGGYTWIWAIYGVPLIFATGVSVSLAFSASSVGGGAARRAT